MSESIHPRASTIAPPLACITFLATNLVASPVLAEDRTIDGTNNNLNHPYYGATLTQLVRLGSPAYTDGFASPAGADRPNPRFISNTVCAQSASIPSPEGASGFVFQWGQFLDHDLDLTEAAEPPEPFHVVVPAGDPVFPAGAIIPLLRNQYDAATGTGPGNPRQQLNQLTAFVDASNVYGSDAIRALALRANDGTGRLKTSEWNMLPFNHAGLPNAPGPDKKFYLAGDVRANEQIALTAIHTLFMREHNRQADAIANANPGLTDEEIYQAARARVGALMQIITYNEFLTVVLGPSALSPYDGYDDTVDPGIAGEFSAAAFRFGHTLLPPVLYRLKKNGAPIPEGHLSLRDAFFMFSPFDPSEGKSIEPLLRGLALVRAQSLDAFVVDDVRNFLFGDPAAGGLDLISLNIQRGRDHGLPSYNEMREVLGLGAVETFDQISSNPVVQERLELAYGNVDAIDLWVGGVSEDHVPGALLGPTLHAIVRDQFERLRDGDRFWYQLVFSGAELAELESTTLKDIIVRNTSIKKGEIGASAFRAL